MEKQLLYMYIDDFYGFKKQEFNFTTDVSFNVYGTEQLILQKMNCEKPLLKGFWGKNISDVSVMIGDNGSGKTTLIKIICRWLCCFSQGCLPQEKGILVFRQGSGIGYIGFEKENMLNLSVQIPEAEIYTISKLANFTKDLQLLYFSNTMTNLNLVNDILWDYSLTNRILTANTSKWQLYEDIIKNYNWKEFCNQVDTALNDDTGAFPVHYLQMEVQHLEFNTIHSQQLRQMEEVISNLSDLWNFYFANHQESEMSVNKVLIIELLKAMLIGVIKYILQCYNYGSETVNILQRIVNYYSSHCLDEGIEEGIECFKQFLIDLVLDSDCRTDNYEMRNNIVEFISLLQSNIENADIPFVEQWRFDLGEEGLSIGQINIESDNREKFKRFWEIYKKVDIYMEKVSFYWDASSGERNWVSLFSILTDIPGRDIWLFLDEPDNTLHPDWQRILLDKIIEVCNGKNYFGKKVQLWITTHSPIMLSDMPGNSVIYLKDKENLGCQIKETFGQNIYALFNHAFFLHEGVIGTFASKKIEEVLRKLQNVERILLEGDIESKKIEQLSLDLEYCEALADLLAEPLFKRQMMDYIMNFKKIIEIERVQEEKTYD